MCYRQDLVGLEHLVYPFKTHVLDRPIIESFTLFILVISSDSAQQNESSFTNLGCSSLHTAFEKKRGVDKVLAPHNFLLFFKTLKMSAKSNQGFRMQ